MKSSLVRKWPLKTKKDKATYCNICGFMGTYGNGVWNRCFNHLNTEPKIYFSAANTIDSWTGSGY